MCADDDTRNTDDKGKQKKRPAEARHQHGENAEKRPGGCRMAGGKTFIEIVARKWSEAIGAHFKEKLRPCPPDQEFQRMDENARRSDRQKEISQKPPCRPQPSIVGLRR
ncbi:hypothetical protein D3C72_1037610 [compost metagenome]